MPLIQRWPLQWTSSHPWIWGLSFGVIVGCGVVLLSALRYGFRLSNLVLGLVVFITFGLLGFLGGLLRTLTPGGPT